MKNLKTLFISLPLLALLLSGCKIFPIPTHGLDPKPFIALAKQAPCAGTDNRLFVIDQKYVYWDRGASCQDQIQRLYGKTPDKLLCIHFATLNGPSTTCKTPALRTLFDTILANRQRPDLGLGAGHLVIKLVIPPQDSVNLVFTSVAKEQFSAIQTRRNVVIRDAVAWASLWAEHTANRTPVPPLPPVDFSTQMLVGIFAGNTAGCHEFEIRRVNAVGTKLVVDYEDRDITASTICLFAITNPMHVVAIPRIEGEVVFNQITPERIEFNTIDRATYSGVQEPMNVLIRDKLSWRLLWAKHTGATNSVPEIDFSTTMVIGVFRGVLPNGCYSTEITDVYRVKSVINVARVDTVPGPDAFCTQALVQPAHLIAIPASNDPVVFSAEQKTVP